MSAVEPIMHAHRNDDVIATQGSKWGRFVRYLCDLRPGGYREDRKERWEIRNAD